MCAWIELWALRQAWIHTSTSSLGFECDPCEIERARARAEGSLSLLPHYCLWPEADSLTMSSSVVIVLPPTPHAGSPLASSLSQTSSLALAVAPSHCQLEFSSDRHTLHIKTYIWKLSDCCLTIVVSGCLALMMTPISSTEISDYQSHDWPCSNREINGLVKFIFTNTNNSKHNSRTFVSEVGMLYAFVALFWRRSLNSRTKPH